MFVYNLKQKVFFEAFVDEDREEHAEFKDASLIEKTGSSRKVVKSDLSTIHHGRGYFIFHLQKGCDYELEILETQSGEKIKIPIDIEGSNK